MNLVTLQNYRCFRERQEARLAPLTFLVGENSTGKTSFLALVRALREVAFESRVPDFRQQPYDLGTFSEIAYNRARGGAKSFEAGFSRKISAMSARLGRLVDELVSFAVTFEPRNAAPYPTKRRLSADERCLEVTQDTIRFSVSDRETTIPAPERLLPGGVDQLDPPFMYVALWHWPMFVLSEQSPGHTPERAFDPLTETEMEDISELAAALPRLISHSRNLSHTFAGAPVRSMPKRTYDPSRPFQDPEGEYIPTLLANMSRHSPDEWQNLKGALEEFGKASGLFNEITVERLGNGEGAPFQLQVRKSNGRLKGRWRNLIDVGYGVSQTLPVLIELLREDHASMFLLQQPEVHLHPMAQAALGSLFCQIASWNRQIIVETHSDYILNRVFMDVRDRKTNLKPEDISILYFEPGEQDVKIHSIGLDEYGNIENPPLHYRQFFMDETRRFIGL